MDEGSPQALLHQRKMSLREPPAHVKATFGLMGVVGTAINIILFVADIVSDAALAYVLWRQADERGRQSELMTWFIITLCIIIVPMVIINICSLLWYWQNKLCLGDYCVLHKMSTSQVVIRVIVHILLLGPLIRYVDIMRYGVKMKREVKHVEMGPQGAAVLRRTPKGEVHAVLQMVISRDTAMLDMMHSFLQDAPQLIFQIFLLYRSPEIITGNDEVSSATKAVQVWKILLGVFALSWSLVSYQDELRRSVPEKEQLSCCGTTTCLLWRTTMVASRIITIGSFAAILQPDQDPRSILSIRWPDSHGNIVIPFPVVTAFVLATHWLIMTAWIHAQGTRFCALDDGSARPVLEMLYNCVMGLVHIFCYVNVKDTPSRRRMAFFYIFCLVENTAMIAVWYVELPERVVCSHPNIPTRMARAGGQYSQFYSIFWKLPKRSVWRDSGGAIIGFNVLKVFNNPDAIDQNVPTVKNADKKEETGQDRLRQMFSYDEFGDLNPEMTTIAQCAMLGVLTGSLIGGTLQSKESYLKFIERNQGTAFQNAFDAKRQLQTKVTLGFARGAWMWGWRLGLFCGSFMFFTTVVSVYRGKSALLEYVTAGSTTGLLYKFKQGPRAMVAGGIIGGALGTIAGLSNLAIIYLTGISMDEARYWQYRWKEEQNEKRLKSLREARFRDFDVLTKHHEELSTNKVDLLSAIDKDEDHNE
ncbi:uncharacterized protein 140up isoform X2 [Panulirus ornatus]|uniref:uncharacterized protein 140up isoform X2 n=1 Tax=Panulirus ornatus TaxID=150431 RepID=UPI003A8850C3